MYEEEKKEIVPMKSILIILCIIISVGLIVFISNINSSDKKNDNGEYEDTPNTENKDEEKEENKDDNKEDKEEVKLEIIDLNSKSRPIAVMINNHPQAVGVQSGLQDAYLVYEMQVEYGLTRLMALFKDKNTAKIGSVRSSRHNYLDYVLENDAIYVHYGFSEIAEKQIPQFGINNINGLYDGAFWRDSSLNVAYEHTAFTSIEKAVINAKQKGYRMETSNGTLLKYSADAIDLKGKNGSLVTNNVNLAFSTSTVVSFVYDKDNNNYKRFVNNVANKDYVTKKQYTAKNIIALKVNSRIIEGTLQDYYNVGSGDGYYITNGYAVPIKWSKESRSAKTVYRYLNGEEIVVNDGNTYIELLPLGNSIKIS